MSGAPFPDSDPRANRLLGLLREREFEAIRGALRPVVLGQSRTLYQAGDVIEDFIFPTRGVVSMLVSVPEGTAIEVGTVGKEGVAGIFALFNERASIDAVTDVEGVGFALPVDKVSGAMEPPTQLRALLLRYAGILFSMVAQCGACNASHPVSVRLARWLLMIHDRIEGDTFPLTHEVISHMLGVQRHTVSVEAALMRTLGAITYRRGIITIVDRSRLEELTCECYEIIRQRTG